MALPTWPRVGMTLTAGVVRLAQNEISGYSIQYAAACLTRQNGCNRYRENVTIHGARVRDAYGELPFIPPAPRPTGDSISQIAAFA